ncbi:MAG: Gfo/Idh/MocA family oxidoreductase [Fibrella sp.]|nr:Gfo/Idh/MocA family oxidoreductase [Armatimonadota bacterium]
MSTPRVAVIGYGFAGRCFHSYLVSLAPGLELAGIASRDAATRERIVAERGCRAYESFEQVLADPDIHVVVLATPNHTHTDLAITAMDAGKNVVSDKVMCLTLPDCDRMIEAARRNNVLLSVFQNRRWDGDFLTLQQAMRDGTLGTVKYIEMAWQGMGAWGGWRGQAEMGGGRFFDLGAHLADQLALLFPQAIESVYCRMHHDYTTTDVESEALLVATFADGCTGVCDLSGMTTISKPRFRAHGDRASFVKYGLDPQEKAMIAGDIDAASESPENYAIIHDKQTEIRVPTLAGRWRSFYENIGDTLAGRATLAVTPESVRRGIAILDAAKRSAQSGEVVRLARHTGG